MTTDSEPEHSGGSPIPDSAADRRLWQFAFVRDLAGLAALLVLLWLVYLTRWVLAPILLGFTFAYAVEPLLARGSRALNVSRAVVVGAFLVVVAAAATAVTLWLGPRLNAELQRFAERHAEHVRTLESTFDTAAGLDVSTNLADYQDSARVTGALARGVARFFGFVGYLLAATTYLLLAAILTTVFFAFFALRFDSLGNAKFLVPESVRERVWRCVQDVDAAFSAYIRGQLVVALFTTTGFCIGFYLADVPYWFAISLTGGVLSLIPYGQMSGWLLAVSAKLAETATPETQFGWFAVLVAPTLVYAVTQSVETWVVTPTVQGRAARLHPLAIIVVLLVGGTLMGIVGVVLAIPTAASLRSIYRREFHPRLTDWIRST